MEILTADVRENDAPRLVRVMLCQDIDFRFPTSELPFELHSCKDTTLLADFCEGVGSNVFLIDLTLLSNSEMVQLGARIGQLNNAFTIALSREQDRFECERILRMGFAGLLRRDESPQTLIRAIQAVANGQLWFPREILSRVLRALLGHEGKTQLRSREMEILRLIGSGLSNQQIANTLFISRETVRWHVKSLYSKLGIKGRRSAREYYRSLQRAGTPKPARAEIGNGSRPSETDKLTGS